MKKLNKQQKEHLKKSLLKALNITCYVVTGLTLTIALIVGINACSPKSEVQSYDYISLNEKPIYKSINTEQLTYNTLNNINDSGDVYVSANSLYYFHNYKENLGFNGTYVYSYNTSGSSANSGIYAYTYNNSNSLVSSQYMVVKAIRVLYNSNGAFINYVDTSNNEDTLIYLNGSGYKGLLVFEDNRVWKATYNVNTNSLPKLASQQLFNGNLTYIDNLWSTMSYGNDYVDYLTSSQIVKYQSFLNEYYIYPNSNTYLQPFVVPIDSLLSNNSYVHLPIATYNSSDSIGMYLNNAYRYNTNLYIDEYRSNGSTYIRPLFYSMAGFNSYDFGGQNLGYSEMVSNHEYITNYCGYYKFHNCYVNYFRYCFIFNGSYSTINLQNVHTNINIRGVDFPKVLQVCYSNTSIYYDYFYFWSSGQPYNALDLIYNDFFHIYDYLIADTYFGSNGSRLYQQNRFNPITFYYVNYQFMYNCLRYGSPYDMIGSYNPLLEYDLQNPITSGNEGNGNIESSSGLGSLFDMFSLAFSSVADVLNIQLFGAFTIGSIMLLPLVVSIILFIVYLFKR